MSNIGDHNFLTELEWVAESAQNPHSNNYDRYCDWYEWQQDAKSQEREIRKVTNIRTKLGWSRCKLFKRISSMPLHVFNIMRKIEPQFATNTPEGKRLLHKLLLRRPEFSVRWD